MVVLGREKKYLALAANILLSVLVNCGMSRETVSYRVQAFTSVIAVTVIRATDKESFSSFSKFLGMSRGVFYSNIRQGQ